MAMTEDGPVVAYRDRTQDEVRDIAVVRGTASGWTKPVVVHDDGWRLPGCPVNGPQLDALHRDVVVAWFTAASGKGRVYCAFSNDAAASFGPALQVDEGHAMGRVDVGMLADGSAVVTWIEAEENDAAVVARRVSRDGHHGALLRLGAAPASSTIGVPRLAASKQSVLVAWNGEKSIEIATIELPKE
jgi:hypothetical protein